MKVYKRIFALIMLFVLISSGASAKVNATETGIFDKENVLTQQSRNYIIESNNSLYSYTGAKIIFYITNECGDDISKYTQEVFYAEGLDSFGNKNSVLVVIDPQGKDYCAKPGVAISRSFTETLLGQYLIESFEPYFQAGDINGGAISLYDKIASWYKESYSIADLSRVKEDDVQLSEGEKANSPLEIFEKILLVIVLILVFGVVALYIIRGIIKYELKKKKERQSTFVDHTNAHEIVEEMHENKKNKEKEKKSIFYRKMAESKPPAEEEEKSVPVKEKKHKKHSYSFNVGIDLDKEFADIDIDDIISKNTK